MALATMQFLTRNKEEKKTAFGLSVPTIFLLCRGTF